MHPAMTRADDDFLLVVVVANGVLRDPRGDEMGFELRALFYLEYNFGELVEDFAFGGREIMEGGTIRAGAEIAGL